MKTSPNSSKHRARLLAVMAYAGLAAAVVAVGGCDRRTPSAKAVSTSSNKLQTVMSPSTSSEGGATWASKQYDDVISTVKNANGQGLSGEKAAAKLLQAESQMGLSEQPFSQATSLENEVDNRVTVLRSVLAQWIRENSAAQEAGLYNPAETIAKADTSAKEFDSKAAGASKRRDDLAGQIKDLEGQANGKMDQVRAEETAIAQMHDQAGSMKATEAAKVIEQAAQRRRAADKIRTEGSLLQAQADQLQPQFREAELMVQQFQAQAKTYRDAIETMEKRAASKKEEVAKARAAAGVAATELDRLLGEVRGLREGKVAESYDAAIKALQNAATTAKEAQADQSLISAKVTSGNIQQSLGDAFWAKAQGLMRYEMLLTRLATVKPALPKASDYASEATKAKEAAAEALGSAKDAYDSASTSFSSVKVRGDAKEKIELLSNKLAAISQITAGQGLDALASLAQGTYKPKGEEAPPDQAADGAKAPEPAAAATPAADPNAALTASVDRMISAIRDGDAAALGDLVDAPSPELKTLMVAQFKTIGAILKLDAVCMEKLQGRFSEKLMAFAQASGQPAQFKADELSKLSTLKASDLTLSADNGTATLTFPGLPQTLTLKEVDGAWKLQAPASSLATPPATLGMLTKATMATNEALETLTSQVQDGTQTSLDAMVPALMMMVQQKIGGGGGPGGGGG